MTIIQKILKDLNQNMEINYAIDCYKTKNMNNGYYKLWLINGKYSYVTDENFQKIKPYISYKEKLQNPTDKLIKNILSSFDLYKKELELVNQSAV